MTVMDMTPEALADLIEPLRKDGHLKPLRIRRCDGRGCHHLGVYEMNGQQVVLLSRVRLSPGLADEINGGDREVPARAWIGHRAPAGLIYGCAHHIARTE